jgi:protein-disulfide isomerase
MSFIKQNLGNKPSLLKPISILIAISLIIGGTYYFLGKKKSESENSKEESNQEVKSSGLDQGKSIENVGDVEEVVAKWIEANPQAIIQSVSNMQKKAMEEQMKDAQKNIGAKKNELLDKNSPSFAPSGYNVTIVEFFDYACGYCKKAEATVEELLKEDKKIRIIYKEFPILGAPSMEMSTVALAVHILEPKSYQKFHQALMKSNERGKDAALKVAESVGINIEKLTKILKDDEEKISKQLQENLTLGGSIGINGTPGFVVGEELIPGALELSAMKEKVASVRKK